MSFDIYCDYSPCQTCGRGGNSVNIANVTHNVNSMVEKMWEGIGMELEGTEPRSYYHKRSWGRLDGHKLRGVKPIVDKALVWLGANEATLLPMNPENGWGSTACLRRVLVALSDAFDNRPEATIRVSG